MNWLITFLVMAGLDFCWPFYIKAVHTKGPFRASIWAVVLMMFSGIAAIEYVNDPWMLIPAGAGAFVGTYAAVVASHRGK